MPWFPDFIGAMGLARRPPAWAASQMLARDLSAHLEHGATMSADFAALIRERP